jgi:hypothetical protein
MECVAVTVPSVGSDDRNIMNVAFTVLSALVAIALLGSGAVKLAGAKQSLQIRSPPKPGEIAVARYWVHTNHHRRATTSPAGLHRTRSHRKGETHVQETVCRGRRGSGHVRSTRWNGMGRAAVRPGLQ